MGTWSVSVYLGKPTGRWLFKNGLLSRGPVLGLARGAKVVGEPMGLKFLYTSELKNVDCRFPRSSRTCLNVLVSVEGAKRL